MHYKQFIFLIILLINSLHAMEYDLEGVGYAADNNSLAAHPTFNIKDLVFSRLCERNKSVKILEEHEHYIRALSYSPDGQYIISGSSDFTIKIWNKYSGKCIKTILGKEDIQKNKRFTLAPQCHMNLGEPINVFESSVHTNCITCIACCPNGKFFASGSDDKTIKIWDMASGYCIKTLRGHEDSILSLTWDLQGNYLVSACADKTIKIWNMQSFVCSKTLQGHGDRVSSVSWSPNGQYLVSGSWDQTIKVWSMQSFECIKTFQEHTAPISSVVWSPDGSCFASASHDTTVKIWSLHSDACIMTLLGHKDVVHEVTWSRYGKYLASSSFDTTIKIWDIYSGDCIITLNEGDLVLATVKWLPDGMYIVSGANNNLIKMWNLDLVIKIYEYLSRGLNFFEQVLLHSIENAGKPYQLGFGDQLVFNGLGNGDQQVGNSIKQALNQYIIEYR